MSATKSMYENSALEAYINKVPRWAWHVFFWLGFLGFFIPLFGTLGGSYADQAAIELIHIWEKLLVTYWTLYFLMPKFLFKGRYMVFTLLLVLGILVGATINWTTTYYFEIHWLDRYKQWDFGPYFQPLKILKFTTYMYPVVAIAIVVKLAKTWYQQNRKTQELQQEKLAAELKFLKGQIHPHFLFNTLNNIYALTLKKDDKAPDMVLKLSQLLDYMLYECNVPKVQIQKEIDLVNSYMDLEKVRYGDRLDIDVQVTGDLIGKEIPPLLILPLVENSFKHGLSASGQKAWLKLKLTANEKGVEIEVANSKVEGPTKNESYKEGIGQKNVQRRLELLYPDQHTFTIEDQAHAYLVRIKINA